MKNIHMNHLIKRLYVKSCIYVDSNRRTIHQCGFAILVYETFVVYLTFLMGYFGPNQSVVVKVNELNEANFEFAVFPILLIIGFWTVYDILKHKEAV